MIVLDDHQYELVMRGLRQGLPTQDRTQAIETLRLAMLQGIERELKFANGQRALAPNQAD